MNVRRLLIITIGLLLIFVVSIGIISIDHPIILQWITGSARHFGRPIAATIYTNGEVNENLKIFYTDQPDNYLLYIADTDPSKSAGILNLNLNEKYIGTPGGTSSIENDFIAGHLFQNKKEEIYIPVRDNATGANFDPRFSLTNEELKFKMPRDFALDSVRIEWLR